MEWCLAQSNKLRECPLDKYLNEYEWSRGRGKSIAVIRMQNAEIDPYVSYPLGIIVETFLNQANC